VAGRVTEKVKTVRFPTVICFYYTAFYKKKQWYFEKFSKLPIGSVFAALKIDKTEKSVV
jgi:hypothetical protein